MEDMRILVIFLLVTTAALAGPKHKRDGSNLPIKEKEFASHLSIRQRKIFCGKFNYEQRQMAIKYTRGRGMDQCFTPDEAVRKVMEETGMSLAGKGRYEE